MHVLCNSGTKMADKPSPSFSTSINLLRQATDMLSNIVSQPRGDATTTVLPNNSSQSTEQVQPAPECSNSVDTWICLSDQRTVPSVQKSLSYYYIIILLLFNFATRAGTPQRREHITVVYHRYFPCGRKPECPEETHDFRQSVDFYSFHMRTKFESFRNPGWGSNPRP